MPQESPVFPEEAIARPFSGENCLPKEVRSSRPSIFRDPVEARQSLAGDAAARRGPGGIASSPKAGLRFAFFQTRIASKAPLAIILSNRELRTVSLAASYKRANALVCALLFKERVMYLPIQFLPGASLSLVAASATILYIEAIYL
jgi:hypothetical protein